MVSKEWEVVLVATFCLGLSLAGILLTGGPHFDHALEGVVGYVMIFAGGTGVGLFLADQTIRFRWFQPS